MYSTVDVFSTTYYKSFVTGASRGSEWLANGRFTLKVHPSCIDASRIVIAFSVFVK